MSGNPSPYAKGACRHSGEDCLRNKSTHQNYFTMFCNFHAYLDVVCYRIKSKFCKQSCFIYAHRNLLKSVTARARPNQLNKILVQLWRLRGLSRTFWNLGMSFGLVDRTQISFNVTLDIEIMNIKVKKCTNFFCNFLFLVLSRKRFGSRSFELWEIRKVFVFQISWFQKTNYWGHKSNSYMARGFINRI